LPGPIEVQRWPSRKRWKRAAALRWPIGNGAVPGAVFAAAIVVLLAFADGGYTPSAWRAAILVCVAAAGLRLVLGPVGRLTRAHGLVVGGLVALAGWTALSAAWSPDPATSLLEAQRTLVYVALAAAAAVLGGSLLFGTLAGIGVVCSWALGQRFLAGPPDPPDPFEGTLLQEPLGYANGLGALAAIGLVVALTLIVREQRLRVVLVPLVAGFGVTLVLTGSRGGLAAAAIGAFVGLALAFGRARIARLALVGAGLALALALALPAGPYEDELAERGGNRPLYWHVAWEDARDAPLVGRGAGTFALSWLERRPIDDGARDAHSLYVETAGELGAVGLLLILLALAPPLAVALRGRGSPAAAAGYVTFLAHAGVDWDWELPAVTVAGLLCGISVLLSERASSAGLEHLQSEPVEGVR